MHTGIEAAFAVSLRTHEGGPRTQHAVLLQQQQVGQILALGVIDEDEIQERGVVRSLDRFDGGILQRTEG